MKLADLATGSDWTDESGSLVIIMIIRILDREKY